MKTDSTSNVVPVLSISGSDGTGGAGIQGDVKTIAALGGYAVTVMTQVAVQSLNNVRACHTLPVDVVQQQLDVVLEDIKPAAVKVGMAGNPEVVRVIAAALRGMDRIVYAPGVESSSGGRLMAVDELQEARARLLPLADILVLKAKDAILFLGDEWTHHGPVDMVSTAEAIDVAKRLLRLGSKNVLVYGFSSSDGLSSSVLVTQSGVVSHYALSETDYIKTHGLGSTLSSSVATFMGFGREVEDAVSAAHEYVRSIVLYSIELHGGARANLIRRGEAVRLTDRLVELYNKLMQLVAEHHKKQHDVAFYANALCVSPRYLAQVTHRVVNKTPKAVLEDYILNEVERQIQYTSEPLQRIAMVFGFKTQAQFSKFLRKKRGLSPTEIRQGASKA